MAALDRRSSLGKRWRRIAGGGSLVRWGVMIGLGAVELRHLDTSGDNRETSNLDL
jgi:hypothetical protein